MEKINREQLKELKNKNGRQFIMFSTEWCGECKMNCLLIEDMKDKLSELTLYKIDVDENNLWADDGDEEYKIMSVPTYQIMENGALVKEKAGFLTQDELFELIK